MKTATIIATVVALCGCNANGRFGRLQHRKSHEAPSPAASMRNVRAEDIPTSRVVGTLRGTPFVMTSARYRVELFPGRERIDLFLSEAPVPSQCAQPGASDSRSVWVRYGGVTRWPVGDARVGNGNGDLELHYEYLDRGMWRGQEGGAGLVHVDQAGADHLDGRLAVCFADATQSCVRGAFHAKRCWSDLDVESAAGGLTGARARKDESAFRPKPP